MDGYDGNMDKECIKLCDALNRLPGVRTFESCCGHLKTNYSIWLRTGNLYSIAVIARVFDKRYAATSVLWDTNIETDDMESTPQFCIRIHSRDVHKTMEDMLHDVDVLSESVEYWSGDEFKRYFGFNEETCEGCVNWKGCITCVNHDQKQTLGKQ